MIIDHAPRFLGIPIDSLPCDNPLPSDEMAKYCSLVDSLGWLAQAFHPDIFITYKAIAGFVGGNNNYACITTPKYYRSAIYCLQYLAGTTTQGI